MPYLWAGVIRWKRRPTRGWGICSVDQLQVGSRVQVTRKDNVRTWVKVGRRLDDEFPDLWVYAVEKENEAQEEPEDAEEPKPKTLWDFVQSGEEIE